jgi:hypothetical protein
MVVTAKVGRGLRLTVIGLCLSVTALCPAAVHFVTVAGLGGEPDYEQRFASLAKEVDKIVQGSAGENKTYTLSGAEGTKAKLTQALNQIAAEAKPDDSFVLLMIGHGSFDGNDYKFNLRGPDITGPELAALCDRIVAGRQLIVNTSSSSGGALKALQRPNRALVAATRSGNEKNATVFGRFWVEAMRDPAADVDKNEIVTALEAYRYADRKTASFYETNKRIATEHAMLEDTGKADPVRNPSDENGQGMLAARLTLVRFGSAQKAAANPAKQGLLARKDDLEARIDRLKLEKAAMPTDVYRRQLSALLVELARVQEELDK